MTTSPFSSDWGWRVAENPFLLPPGSTPSPEPKIVPSATPTPRDPDRYIALPPSIESATHRITRPETSPTVVPAEPQQQPEPEPESPPEPVAEETRLAVVSVAEAETAAAPVSAAGPTDFALVLPDGSRLAVDGPLVLGRDPAPPGARPDARAVPLDDPGKTVSKTHALVEPGASGIRVVELHSTNGVAISSSGIRTVLAAGGEAIAPPGSVIELGSFTVLVAAR